MLQIGQSVSKKVVSIPASESEFEGTGRTTIRIGNLREFTPERHAHEGSGIFESQVYAPAAYGHVHISEKAVRSFANARICDNSVHIELHFKAKDLKKRSPQDTIDYVKAATDILRTLSK